MRRMMLLSIVLLCVSSLAFAQFPGSIGLFADPAGNLCDLYVAAPGLVSIYVVHILSPGATGAEFRVICDETANLLYLSDTVTSPYLSIGNSQAGIAIAYEECVGSANMILTIQYYAQTSPGTCTSCRVVEDPNAAPPGIYVADCSDPPLLLNATGGEIVVNPDYTCGCYVPVEETSWGKIKSLYK